MLPFSANLCHEGAATTRLENYNNLLKAESYCFNSDNFLNPWDVRGNPNLNLFTNTIILMFLMTVDSPEWI